MSLPHIITKGPASGFRALTMIVKLRRACEAVWEPWDKARTAFALNPNTETFAARMVLGNAVLNFQDVNDIWMIAPQGVDLGYKTWDDYYNAVLAWKERV